MSGPNEPLLTREQLAQLQEARADAFKPHRSPSLEQAAHGRLADMLWAYHARLIASAEQGMAAGLEGLSANATLIVLRAENERLRRLLREVVLWAEGCSFRLGAMGARMDMTDWAGLNAARAELEPGLPAIESFSGLDSHRLPAPAPANRPDAQTATDAAET